MKTKETEKIELQEEYNKLKNQYSKLIRQEEILESEKSPHFMLSLIASGTGIGMIFSGLHGHESMFLIIGGGIIALCIVFGFRAYETNSYINHKKDIIYREMKKISKEMDIIEQKINRIKTIPIIVSNNKNIDWLDIQDTIENDCFSSLIQLLNKEERETLINNREIIKNYIMEYEKIEQFFDGNEYSDSLILDYAPETEENIVKNVIFIYIQALKELIYIFLDENYGYDKFIKDNNITQEGKILKKLAQKLTFIETEYCT